MAGKISFHCEPCCRQDFHGLFPGNGISVSNFFGADKGGGRKKSKNVQRAFDCVLVQVFHPQQEPRTHEGLQGLAPAKPGRPRLCEEELLERRHERQRRYYETVVGHEVTPRVARKRLTDEERRAKWRERYYARMQKQGKTVTPRQKLTDMERLERRRARQRKYQAKVREQARKWKELKAQAVREGLQDVSAALSGR